MGQEPPEEAVRSPWSGRRRAREAVATPSQRTTRRTAASQRQGLRSSEAGRADQEGEPLVTPAVRSRGGAFPSCLTFLPFLLAFPSCLFSLPVVPAFTPCLSFLAFACCLSVLSFRPALPSHWRRQRYGPVWYFSLQAFHMVFAAVFHSITSSSICAGAWVIESALGSSLAVGGRGAPSCRCSPYFMEVPGDFIHGNFEIPLPFVMRPNSLRSASSSSPHPSVQWFFIYAIFLSTGPWSLLISVAPGFYTAVGIHVASTKLWVCT